MKKIKQSTLLTIVGILAVLAFLIMAPHAATFKALIQAVQKRADPVTVSYQIDVPDSGWQPPAANGATVGNQDDSSAMTALRVKLDPGNKQIGITYSTYTQQAGWSAWASDGQDSGTSGSRNALEAVQIKLTGQDAGDKVLYYRTYVKNVGWLDWAGSGASAGTTGTGYPIEAIEIKVLPTGADAPGSTYEPFLQSEAGVVLETKTIASSRVQHEYQFMFIADSHIVSLSDATTPEVRAAELPRQGLFTSDAGIPSASLFSRYVDIANTNNVTALLMGGDIIDCPSDENLDVMKKGLSQLKSPYLYTVGNHDWTYLWDANDDAARSKYMSRLDAFTQGKSDCHTLEYPDLTIVALDDSSGQFTQGAAEGLEKAIARSKPTIVMFHIPLAESKLNALSTRDWGKPLTLGDGGYPPNQWSQKVMDLITASNSPVIAVLDGHLHFLYSGSASSLAPQYVTDAAYKGRALMLTIRPQ